MAVAEDLTGLILAGGAGRRMQGRDKGLVEWHGKPLIEHVAMRLRPQVRRLLISCNRNQATYAKYGDALIGDFREDYQGPLAGLEAAIGQIDSEFLLVTPCDAPLLPPNIGERLLEPLRSITDAKAPAISFASDGERDQYLFAAMRTSCLDTITTYLDSGQRTVRGWYREFPHVSVDFSDQKGAFLNLNSLAQ